MNRNHLPSSLAAALALVAGFLVSDLPARAHAIESSLERVSGLTDALVLESRFGPDQPAADAEVRLVAPGGASITMGRTDAQGSLRFQLPENVGADWEVVVDQGPGHRDYLELPAGAQARRIQRQPLSVPTPLATLVGLAALGGLGCTALRRRRR
ncbi:MAG: hypothetical protein VKK94_02760 [Cyanobacteriota bacterium]|jgi:nickel transport protein|nr:hypothetical protein [Cyanobacteriota bacterium]